MGFFPVTLKLRGLFCYKETPSNYSQEFLGLERSDKNKQVRYKHLTEKAFADFASEDLPVEWLSNVLNKNGLFYMHKISFNIAL